jgi:hypothetical protein
LKKAKIRLKNQKIKRKPSDADPIEVYRKFFNGDNSIKEELNHE